MARFLRLPLEQASAATGAALPAPESISHAEKNMTPSTARTILVLKESGGVRSFRADHATLHLLYDSTPLSICGAMYDHDCVFLCRSEFRPSDGQNPFAARFPAHMDPTTRGDILVVGSDENGEACDIDILELSEIFQPT